MSTSAALSQPMKNTNSRARNNGMESKRPPMCLYPLMNFPLESSNPWRPNSAAIK